MLDGNATTTANNTAAANNLVLVTTAQETVTTRPRSIAAKLAALGGRAVSMTVEKAGKMKDLPERVFFAARNLPAGTSETAKKVVQFVAAASQNSTVREAGLKTVRVTGNILKKTLPPAAVAATGAYFGGALVGVAGAVAVYKTSGYITGKFAGTEGSGDSDSGTALPLNDNVRNDNSHANLPTDVVNGNDPMEIDNAETPNTEKQLIEEDLEKFTDLAMTGNPDEIKAELQEQKLLILDFGYNPGDVEKYQNLLKVLNTEIRRLNSKTRKRVVLTPERREALKEILIRSANFMHERNI